MRVQTEEWRKFIPGIRMYKGKKTYFYNGEKLWDVTDDWEDQLLVHDKDERNSWEVIIVLPGVEVIPDFTENLNSSIQGLKIGCWVFGHYSSIVGGCLNQSSIQSN